jgi:hypothetical protein
MIGIFFLILLLMALASIGSNLVMRTQLVRRRPLNNGSSWWMRGSDEVTRTYRQLFPGSYLPSFIQSVFWLLLAAAAATAVLIALGKRN